ncbi:MAG: type IV secretion system DNA-binding domain-containing protein [bacterium]
MRRIEWEAAQEYTTLRIDVPKNNDRSPLSAEQMFAAIHGIYADSAHYQNHLSFEIVAKSNFIQFYIYLPKHLKDFIEGQIYAQYPAVEIKEVDDYSQAVVRSQVSYSISELALTKPDVYPIRQFTDFEVDPLSAITSVMSNLGTNEQVWFQMIVRPVGDEWQNRGNDKISAIRSGKKSKSGGFFIMIISGIFSFLKDLIVQAIYPTGETQPWFEAKSAGEPPKLSGAVEDSLKAIEQKITKLGFQTRFRILSIANDTLISKDKCRNITAAFKQFNTTNLNGFKMGEVVSNDSEEWERFVTRHFNDDGNILNITELASIFHLPNESVSTPNIVWSGSKKGEPPSDLPLRENTIPEDFTVIGETNFRNVFREFGIKRDDRRRHIYIIGKSGVGKSVLIENMAVNDMLAGRGLIAVDPHGDLIDKLLSCVPDHRIDDVIVFDPSDRNFPIAFNLLDQVDDDFKGIVASGFVGIFKKIFGESWGPRLEHILRNTVLALLDFPNSTMLDIPRMLTNNHFREKVVAKIKDSVIRDFWTNEFAQYDQKFKTEAVAPILNKVGQFLSSDTIRNIVGQPKSRIDIREIMDQKKILLVNLSRGKIGEDNSALLGAMVITKIQMAAMSRANVTVDKRPDCYLYVDEFQNFATDAFSVILSEARKYNLALTIAHQYIAQLPDTVRDAVIGNAGTIISFRVGGADTDTVVKEVEPVFDAHDLVNLDKYHIYIKLLIDGVSSSAFSARTLPPIQALTGNLQRVIDQSHRKYSSLRADVLEMIEGRANEENDEIRAEADLFKKGGLEALLLKKNQDNPVPTTQTVSRPLPQDNVQVEQRPNTVNSPEPNITKQEVLSGANEENNQDQGPKEYKSRVLRYQNIVGDKLYKERTAKAGVKWYFAEAIDENKLQEAGFVIDDQGRKMIDINKKLFVANGQNVSNSGANQSAQHNNNNNNNNNTQHHHGVGNSGSSAPLNQLQIAKAQDVDNSHQQPVVDENSIPNSQDGNLIAMPQIRDEVKIEKANDDKNNIDTHSIVASQPTATNSSAPAPQKDNILKEGEEITFDD